MAQVKALCNIVQEAPDNMVQENVLFKVVLTLWDNMVQVKTLCNVVQQAPDNIGQ